MEQIHFNYKDILRVYRYGFSGRRIGIHFTGIILAYLIYQILVYLSLIIVDGAKAQDIWTSHGLLPILPFVDNDLSVISSIAMWFGIIICGIIYLLSSTLTSKITYEQLRGDSLYTIGNALGVLRTRWKTVIGSFLWLFFLILCLLIIPICIGLLAKIPFLKGTILTISSIFSPIGFLFGILILFIFFVFFAGLFLVPAMSATTEVDAFEIIYQLFSIVWNQPWRLMSYGLLLSALKLFHVPIWALFCIGGFLIALLPTYYLHKLFLQDALLYVNKWLGGIIERISGIFLSDDGAFLGINFGLNNTELPDLSFSTTICAIFLAFMLISLFGGFLGYLFSLASVGTTLIYVILKKHVDGENIIMSSAVVEEQPLLTGDE